MNSPALQDTRVEPDDPEAVVLELDELWSFVRCKHDRRWVRVALCKRTRQVVACVIGGRGEATCKLLWRSVPKAYKQGVCYTDFWRAYQAVLPAAQHQAVGKDSGLTNHVERSNNTLRQRLSRFVRKTLSFSKSDHMHLICLHLFLVRYNLERMENILWWTTAQTFISFLDWPEVIALSVGLLLAYVGYSTVKNALCNLRLCKCPIRDESDCKKKIVVSTESFDEIKEALTKNRGLVIKERARSNRRLRNPLF